MTIQELIDLLTSGQSGITPGPAPAASAPAAASTTPNAVATAKTTATGLPLIGSAAAVGDLLGTEIDPLFGINPGQSSNIGGSIGGAFGLGGALLGELIGGWVGGGVPRSAKSAAIGQALETGGGLDPYIASFVNRGVKGGQVLSESGPSTFEGAVDRLSAMLEGLTGESANPVTGTGFNNNPTFNPEMIGRAGTQFKLPPGYAFLGNDSTDLAAALNDIQRTIGVGQQAGYNESGPSAQDQWKKVISDLIASGNLTKYQGPTGSPGGGTPGSGSIPNVALPHPLNQLANPASAPAPYPV